MTTSKKLLFIGAIALGAQYSTSAHHYSLTPYEYNAQYYYAANSLLEFTQFLRQSNSIKAEKIAQWLEDEIIRPNYLTKDDIIHMASVADNPTLTIASKIRIFNLKMNHNKPSTTLKKLSYGLAFGGLAGLVLFAESYGKIDIVSLYEKYCTAKA